MSGFGMALGALGAGLQGWRDGEKQANADRKQVDMDASEKLTRDANDSLTDSRTALAKATIGNLTTDASNAAELKPIQHKAAVVDEKGKADRATEDVRQALVQQGINGQDLVTKGHEAFLKGQLSADQLGDYMSGSIYEKLKQGDIVGAVNSTNAIVDHPDVFPGTNGKPKIAKASLIQAPDGASDVNGNPVTGEAVMTVDVNGKQSYASTGRMAQSYQRILDQRANKELVILKPGEKITPRRAGVENDNGFYTDAQGNTVKTTGRMGPNGELLAGGAGGAGAGSGAGAKPGKAELDLALKEFMTTPVASALTPDQTANIPLVAEKMLASSLGITPKEAVAMAQDAVLGKNVAAAVGRNTGTIDNIYVNKSYAGGKDFTLATNIGDVKLLGDIKPEVLKAQVQESLTAKYPDPAQQAAVRKAAQDPVYAKTLLDDIAKQIGPDAASDMAKRLPLVRLLGAAPASKADTAAQAAPGKSVIKTAGGIPGYTPQAGVPSDLAARAAAANDAAQQAASEKSKAESIAQQAKATKAKEISWLTPAEISVMRPSEAQKYLQKYQDVLSSDVARALRRQL